MRSTGSNIAEFQNIIYHTTYVVLIYIYYVYDLLLNRNLMNVKLKEWKPDPGPQCRVC